MPTAPSASANAMVLPRGTSSPAPRSRRANPTAQRATSTSGTPLHRRVHELSQAVSPRAVLVLAVLEDGAERDVDRALVDRRLTECGERVGPVDRLRDTRRLVQLEPAQLLDRGGHLARELL